MSSLHSISSNLPKLTTPRSGWLFSYVAGFPMLHTQSSPTRKSQSIDTPVLRPSVAHCDALRDDFDWQSIRMCLAAAPEAHRPALRVSGWFLTCPLANGAGRFTFWRRSIHFLAQVDALSGAGVIFGTGPAPRIGRTCFPLAQVPTPFPHLRQHHRIPAPITMATYARSLHPHTPTSPLCHFAKLPHGDTQ